MSQGLSHVSPQAQITRAQVIPFESRLILVLLREQLCNYFTKKCTQKDY